MAEEIGDRKADNIKSTYARLKQDPEKQSQKIVLSANPGCLSQIQAHLGDEFKVSHPLVFMAQYLKSTPY